MQILQSGERREFSIKNIKLSGFSVVVKLVSTTVNVIPFNLDVDFVKTMFKVILKRDGQQFILMQDDLKALGLSSNIDTMARRAFYQDHSWNIVTVRQTVAVKGESFLVFDIDMKGTLDLQADDELLCEISLQTGVFSANVDTSQSYLEIKPIKSVGFEKYVPYIRSYAITAGERRKTFDLGNNIMSAILLNYNQNDFIQPAVNSITIDSEQYDVTLSNLDLMNRRLVNRPDPGLLPSVGSIDAMDEFDQSFVLFEGMELDKCQIDIQFNPAYVTANNNLLIVHSAYTDVRTLIQHDANVLKAQNEKIADLKQNGENAKIA